MDIHYLDNAATTKPSADSLKAAADSFSEAWGNPSSAHAVGRRASALLEESRKAVLHSLGLPRLTQDRLVFTASGTEANNIAVLGCAHSKTRHETNGQLGTVIISAGEHPSVSGPASLLEKEGYKVVRIPTSGGVLSEDDIRAAVNDAQSPVILAAFMLVNNETGALYDIKKASDIIKSRFPDANIHCDAVQAFTKIRFTPSSLGADTLAVSSHKIHAPRGAGALYISKEIIKRKNISAVMPGGGQENGLRSGTENLAAIAAFACAAAEETADFAKNRAAVESLRALLDGELRALCPEIAFNLPKNGTPDILSITLPKIKSETMLNFLSSRNIFVSAGSACSAYSKKKSEALEAFGLTEEAADSVIRISISHDNTEDDIKALSGALREGIDSLQKKK